MATFKLQELALICALMNPAADHCDHGSVSALCPSKSQAIVYYWEVQYPAFFSNRWRHATLSVMFCFQSLIFGLPFVFSPHICDKTGMMNFWLVFIYFFLCKDFRYQSYCGGA